MVMVGEEAAAEPLPSSCRCPQPYSVLSKPSNPSLTGQREPQARAVC